jgi:S-methylmethionine-dependent homocysteine/selenocysteine methylase
MSIRILDGGLETELQRAGVPLAAPWWTNKTLMTGRGRAIIRTVHEAFLDAGADVLTAATFRCHRRALVGLGLDPSAGAAWMVHAAVGVARAAVGSRRDVLIAGSIAPLTDCYRADPLPPDEELRAEHGWLAAEIARCGVDVVLLESMGSVREARIAVDAVRAAGAVSWAAFACRDDGTLPSGEAVAEAALACEADLVAVNCSSYEATGNALSAIRERYQGPLGAYPNVKGYDGTAPAEDSASVEEADRFGERLNGWRAEHGLALIGGCCGTAPADIGAVRARSRTPDTAGLAGEPEA